MNTASRIIKVHSNPGEMVLNFFAGSGTTGEAAIRAGRSPVLVDNNPEAVRVMTHRLAHAHPAVIGPVVAGPASASSASAGPTSSGADGCQRGSP